MGSGYEEAKRQVVEWRQYRSEHPPPGSLLKAQILLLVSFIISTTALVGCLTWAKANNAPAWLQIEVIACWAPVGALTAWASFSAVRLRWERGLRLQALGSITALLIMLGIFTGLSTIGP